MELKDFVSETLVQIIEGVKDAQSKVVDTEGGSVNPEYSQTPRPHTISRYGKIIQDVEFDVALSVSEGTESKGGIGVVAGVFALGSQGQSNAENASFSRIKFHVPMVLPYGKENE